MPPWLEPDNILIVIPDVIRVAEVYDNRMERRPSAAPDASGRTDQKPKRVLVVDDHPMFRHGVTSVLQQTSDLSLCAEAGSYSQALEAARLHKPDLALVDISMPGTDGLELIKSLRAEHPGLAIIALSMHDESVYALRAVRAGAAGFVNKDAPYEDLLAAIHTALEGRLALSPWLTERLLATAIRTVDPGSHPQFESLSGREVEILRCYGEGLETPQICARLNIGAKTVETYRTRIKEKLGLTGFSDLRRFAAEWISAPSEAVPP